MNPQNDPYLEELVKIRKTLEDIEFILEYVYVPQTENHRQVYKENGKKKWVCDYIKNPLEQLRRNLNALRNSEKN